MIFQNILLQIFHKLNKERTVSASYHLLRGKRSGQTIQDVGIFQLHMYFGILPKLSRKKYDEEIHKLIDQHYLLVQKDGFYELTQLGENEVNNSTFLPFDGWHYRGNEHIFFARLSLIIQSLSHQRSGVMSFIPVQRDEQIQHWVKQFLLINNYQNGELQQKMLDEVIYSLENTNIEDCAKLIVMKRLAGFSLPGFTWQQLSFQEKMEELDVQLLYIACLHSWLNKINEQKDVYPLLNKIAANVQVEVPLTGSAFQTAQLFKKGHSIEQISKIRGLKTSTIEDHIVELVMNDNSFSIEPFVSKQDIQLVLTAVDDYQTRKLKVLHDVVPQLSYFQIRLILSRGEKL